MVEFTHDDSKGNSSVIEKILFDRPVSSLARPNIAIIVSKYAELKIIFNIFEIFRTMGFIPILIADHDFKATGLPADVFMQSKDKRTYLNTDEIIHTVEGCGGVLVVTGGEVNSALELLLSRLASTYKGLIATDNITLFGNNWVSTNKFVFGGTKKLIKSLGYNLSDNDGLKLKAEYLSKISALTDSLILAVDGNQALAVSSKSMNSAVVVNCTGQIQPYEISAIAIALITEKTTSNNSLLDYVLTASHIYREYYLQTGLEGMKIFLNSQF